MQRDNKQISNNWKGPHMVSYMSGIDILFIKMCTLDRETWCKIVIVPISSKLDYWLPQKSITASYRGLSEAPLPTGECKISK